jgi:hypothetical protein
MPTLADIGEDNLIRKLRRSPARPPAAPRQNTPLIRHIVPPHTSSSGLRNMARPTSEKTISFANFGGFMSGTLRLLAKTILSSATSCRPTPAPTGLRSTAQGQPSLGEATLGLSHQTGKQTQHSATTHVHQQRLPSAPPHLCRPRTTLQSTNPRSARLTPRHSCTAAVAGIRQSSAFRHFCTLIPLLTIPLPNLTALRTPP